MADELRGPPLSGQGGGGIGGLLGNLGTMGLDAFFPGAGTIVGALGGLLGGAKGMEFVDEGRDDILNLPGLQGQVPVGGNFGQAADGQFQLEGGLAGNQAALSGATGGLLQGGLFNDPRFQQAFQQNDIAGALGQANQAFGTQQGSQAFGGLQGLFNQQQGLAGMFGNQAAAGPQDLFGGQGQALRSAGVQNQLAAGDFSGLQNAELATLRASAQPAQDRLFNKLQNSLFATGQGGSTGGGQQLEGLFNSFGQQDLNFQNEAFNRASQRSQQMGQQGAQMFGQGAQALGQNLNQFNQQANFANMFGQGAAGLEGQGFGQQLGANQFNTSQGMNRVNQALGLFQQGGDTFAQQFGLGLGSSQGALGFGEFGLNAAAMPAQLQASLLGAGGQTAEALASVAQSRADAAGGFFGGFSDKRLKENIKRIGKWGDFNWYEWDWNDKAKEVGADKEPAYGVIAQEIAELFPAAIGTKDGYLTVNYGVLYNG